MCLYNKLIKNRKYTKNKKNGGQVPPVIDRRIEWVPVGCGNCIECRKQKAQEWRVRMMEDIKANKNGKFITLTFSNESIETIINNEWIEAQNIDGAKQMYPIKELKGYERDNQIATRAIRLFNERWRKEYGKAIRHWMITELGHKGTENIHLHGIMWTDQSVNDIRRIWKYGWIWPRPKYEGKYYVSTRTVNYIVKYVTKIDKQHKEYKSKILTSPGIGANYIKTIAGKKNETELTETYKTSTGHEIALPIYWRNKLFTEDTKERLWIKKLDKEERWVCGEKISVKDGIAKYEQLVQWYRRRNHELGYGGRSNDDRKKYEEDQREIMVQRRIQHGPGRNRTNDIKK